MRALEFGELGGEIPGEFVGLAQEGLARSVAVGRVELVGHMLLVHLVEVVAEEASDDGRQLRAFIDRQLEHLDDAGLVAHRQAVPGFGLLAEAADFPCTNRFEVAGVRMETNTAVPASWSRISSEKSSLPWSLSSRQMSATRRGAG
jgi:hypothetical protein